MLSSLGVSLEGCHGLPARIQAGVNHTVLPCCAAGPSQTEKLCLFNLMQKSRFCHKRSVTNECSTNDRTAQTSQVRSASSGCSPDCPSWLEQHGALKPLRGGRAGGWMGVRARWDGSTSGAGRGAPRGGGGPCELTCIARRRHGPPPDGWCRPRTAASSFPHRRCASPAVSTSHGEPNHPQLPKGVILSQRILARVCTESLESS